jgi:hypothetical protein
MKRCEAPIRGWDDVNHEERERIMIRKGWMAWGGAALLGTLGLSGGVALAEGTTATLTLCRDGTNGLCPTMPTDLNGHPPMIGYIPNTNAGKGMAFSQSYVDYFGWQAFVALNWPADAQGKPLPGATIVSDTTAPRVWASYPTKEDVFGSSADQKAAEAICGKTDGKLLLQRTGKFDSAEFLEAFTPYPLIDKAGNFVLYDVRLNQVDVDYLKTNGLLTEAGQKAFGKPYDFTAGTGDAMGSLEMKTSWRILPDQAEWGRYYTTDAKVAIPGANTIDGQDLCLDTKVGLVGMHIMQKFSTPSEFSEYWSWATFEHVDNAPLADKAPVSQTDGASTMPNLDPPSCSLAANPADTTDYAFYDAACTDGGVACAVNAPPKAAEGIDGYKWAASAPYAAPYLMDKTFGTQVARCWAVYDSAKQVSAAYQKALEGSVWANYTLIGAQWASQSSTGSGPLVALHPYAAPIYLANTTMETYVQINPVMKTKGDDDYAPGSCIACHDMATDKAGNNANFSFLPYDVK